MVLPRRPGLARRLASFVWRGAQRRLDAWVGRDEWPPPTPTVAKVTVLARAEAASVAEGSDVGRFTAHALEYTRELASRLLAEHETLDARDVKRLRTSLRRLRAFVRETATEGAADDHDRRIRRAAKRLGAVRDLDVLLAGIAGRRAASGSELERAALDELEARVARDRASAVARARRRLESTALRDIADGVRDWVATLRDVEAIAQPWWSARRTELVAALASTPIGDDDLEALHRIRIAARRVRYGIEGFGPSAPADAVTWSDDVLALQRALGAHRDAAQLHERLRDEIDRATKRGRITLVRGLEASTIAARSDRARTFALAQAAIAKARARPDCQLPQLRGSDAARSPTRSPPGRSGLA